jgi:NTE family protein
MRIRDGDAPAAREEGEARVENDGRRRVGIACQGGGSHTAFTAGALQGLLRRLPDDVEVVALTGTSGGALCAALAWDGLVRGNVEQGIEKLGRFWGEMAAREPLDRLANHALVTMMSLRELMVLPEVSPYQLPTWGEDRFRAIIAEFFDFEELRALALRPGAPILRIGAVEVLSGHFELFGGEELCVECLLASAAIPELFRAVTVPGRGVFWDGLFSQNPPIDDLIDRQLDELWIIQINSSTCPGVPTETHEIMDRRNALSGNLSMEQELKFIERLNQAVASGKVDGTRYRPIRVSRIPLERELGYLTKLDRSPALLDELREHGNTKARWFLRERAAQRGARSPLREEQRPS